MLRNEGTIVGLDFDINVLDILEFILYVLYPLAKSLYIDLIIDRALQFKQSVFNLLQVKLLIIKSCAVLIHFLDSFDKILFHLFDFLGHFIFKCRIIIMLFNLDRVIILCL